MNNNPLSGGFMPLSTVFTRALMQKGLRLAWISTARNQPNISVLSALLDEAEGAAIPPRDGNGFVDESGGEDDGQVGSSVEAQGDLALGDGDVGRHVDEVTEDLARLSVIVSAHAAGHEAIEA